KGERGRVVRVVQADRGGLRDPAVRPGSRPRRGSGHREEGRERRGDKGSAHGTITIDEGERHGSSGGPSVVPWRHAGGQTGQPVERSLRTRGRRPAVRA